MAPKKNKDEQQKNDEHTLLLNKKTKTAVDGAEERELEQLVDTDLSSNSNNDTCVEVQSTDDVIQAVRTNTTTPTAAATTVLTTKNALDFSSSSCNGKTKGLDHSKADFNSVAIDSTGHGC